MCRRWIARGGRERYETNATFSGRVNITRGNTSIRRFYFSRSRPLYVSLYFLHLRVFPVNIDRSEDTLRPRISILTECCFRLFHARHSFLLFSFLALYVSRVYTGRMFNASMRRVRVFHRSFNLRSRRVSKRSAPLIYRSYKRAVEVV